MNRPFYSTGAFQSERETWMHKVLHHVLLCPWQVQTVL